MTIDLPDGNERTAALDTTRSHHVEAPAGSGKTRLLTLRFLKLLGEVHSPGEIVGLTFTEKAAGEMRSRIIRCLQAARDGKTPRQEADEEMLSLARRALQKQEKHLRTLTSSSGLNLMTFHGFCYHIAKRAPLEAGIAPDCEILGEKDLPLLIAETVRRVMERTLSLPPGAAERRALENRLLARNNSRPSLSVELEEVIANRDRFEDLIREVKKSPAGARADAVRKRLREIVEPHLDRLGRSLRGTALGKHWQPLTAYLASKSADVAGRLPREIPPGSWAALPDWQAMAEALLTREGSPRKSMGPARGFPAGFTRTDWGARVTALDGGTCLLLHETRALPREDAEIPDLDSLLDFIIVAALCIDEFDRTCARGHVMDFIGLENAALRVLSEDNPTELHLFLDDRVRHLLVDEFQDTSRNQWVLIQRLCSGWQPGDGRTLFIVGDPKQSIYAFRKAEVRLFMESREGLPLPGQGTLPLVPLLLKTNFRSRGSLIGWCNGLFGTTVMTAPNPEADEVPFSRSEPAPGAGGEGRVSLFLFTGDRGGAAESEARWLAREVKRVAAESGGAKSIAVLLFTRNRLQRYLAAFREERVPLVVKEGLLLSQRPEILHLLQAARAAARPHDDVAWASLVRSPWNWSDGHTLRRLAEAGGQSWRDKVLTACGAWPEMETLRRAVEGMLTRTGRDPLGRVVRDFWEALDGPRKTAALFGMAGVANARRFFEILEEIEQGVPQETLLRLEAILDTLYEPADPSASRSPVSMMTVHGAKGLEFDVVFIPFMDWKPLSSGSKTPPAYLLERIPGPAGDYLVAMGTDRRTGEPSATYRLLRKFQRERSLGEAKRLLYVAMTRAREALVLSGVCGTKDGTLSGAKGSVLDWVMDHENLQGFTAAAASEGRRQELSLVIDPVLPGKEAEAAPAPHVPAEPLPFEPEKIPYAVESPSASPFEDKAVPDGGGRERPEGILHAARGTVTHRLLNTAVSGGPAPAASAVERALVREGVAPDAAGHLSAEILEEVAATLRDPFIAGLTDNKNPVVRSEWAVEDVAGPGRVRSGVMDLVAFDGGFWWIVDFKTSRPPAGGSNDFPRNQADFYRSQLEAYRSMLANVEGADPERIKAGIYLTATRTWIEVGK